MRQFLVVATLAITLASCQQEIVFDDGSNNNTPTATDYQPTSAGSEWKMASTSLGNYTITSLGTDSIVNGEKFYKFDQSVGGRTYMSKNNGVYVQMAVMPPAGLTRLTYLKDAAAGTQWTDNINAAEMRYSIIGRNLQRTVNGKLYKDVIHVHYDQFAMGIKTASADQYYSKGTGAIESVIRMDMMGMQMTIDSTYLVSSTIK